MGKPREAASARLFMSLIVSSEDILPEGQKALEAMFGEIDLVSQRFPFDFTDYYAKEMGSRLFRHFVTFKDMIPIPRLPEIKLTTNRLEEQLATQEGNRRINIDPGYLCLHHVVLATTKGYSHRPYLRDGIYADLTLIYRNKSFQSLEWTYPDYRQAPVIDFFNQLRKKYLDGLNPGVTDQC
ncbi:MAG TPA: DUF4416 family protein [Thermodesulfobacteriota bacterium]|nr:DUF4416 family protein [Thermodesulfobacteriota bacterium]